jgi:hypothetical protein
MARAYASRVLRLRIVGNRPANPRSGGSGDAESGYRRALARRSARRSRRFLAAATDSA